jgi:uncharacterized protein (TIGR03437 family)
VVSGSSLTYLYDGIGRLIAATDTAGDHAVYSYDSVGNLLAVEKRIAPVVSIVAFNPQSGPVGASVVIQGVGFSGVLDENSVQFNGVQAEVMESTNTQIVAIVPSGATSGPITVTTPTGAATSSLFAVSAASGAPAITHFTPSIGIPGTTVNVIGMNFQDVVANNGVMFNRTLASVTASAVTTIATNVPLGTGSGRITIKTPFGKTVSGEDFFIPPPPYTIGDVEFTGRAAFNEAKLVTVASVNKIALVVFEGAAGQRVSFDIGDVAISRSSLSIYNPDLTSLTLPRTVNTDEFIEPVTLPLTGTYCILIDPEEGSTGNLTLTLHDVPPDVVETISTGEQSVLVSIAVPGQNAGLTFEGTVEQRVNLGVSDVSFATGSGLVKVTILRPDETTLASRLVGRNGDDIDTDPLPETGTYTILVDPQDGKTVSLTLTLSEPLIDTLAIGGPSVPVTLDRAGQDARLTFEGTAEQRVNLGVSEVSFDTGSGVVDVSILDPDGVTLASKFVSGLGRGIHTDPLLDSGIHTIVIDPQDAKTVRLTLTLSEPVAGTLTIDGPSVSIILRLGQGARLTFEGTAGQRLNLDVTEVSFGSGNHAVISILRPDETALVSTTVGVNGGDIAMDGLPDNGTYTVVVAPQASSLNPGATTAKVTLTLSML